MRIFTSVMTVLAFSFSAAQFFYTAEANAASFTCWCTKSPKSTFPITADTKKSAIASLSSFCTQKYGAVPVGTSVAACN